jgi:hypothetical protein
LGVLSGTIDKFLITPADSDGFRIEIIDFKTNRFPSRLPDSLERSIQAATADYELQMQAYALAAWELLLPAVKLRDIQATLHFLDPNIEYQLAGGLLERDACAAAIDKAMSGMVSVRKPEYFLVSPAAHCRACNFLDICPAGQGWLRDPVATETQRHREVKAESTEPKAMRERVNLK